MAVPVSDEQPPPNAQGHDALKALRGWQRFHIRLTALYGGATLLALALLGVIVYWNGVEREVEGLQRRLLSIVTSLATSIDAPAVAELPVDGVEWTPLHRRLLSRFEEVVRQDPDIESIYLLRPTGEPTKLRFVADFTKDGRAGQPGELYDATDIPVMLQGFSRPAVEDEPYTDEFGTTLSGYAPVVTPEGRSIGLVGVDVNASRLAAIRSDVLRGVGVAFGLAMMLLGLVAVLVARNVRRPLTQIIDAATAISKGNLSTRIGLRRGDELGLMSQHIDLMAEQLQEREFVRETFGRYVSEEVAKELLRHRAGLTLGGEERVVTVLFSDMRAYSTISEQMSPPQVVDWLNGYLGAMNAIIDRHHGCVIEFVGDAIFAVFGAPHYIPDHAEQAVRCAIEMRARLAELDEEWRGSGIARLWQEAGVETLSARIGIHTGRVVAGNLGSDMRMKYAVIGDTVNVAGRLEDLNKALNTDILISRDVYVQLPVELTQDAVEHGAHTVKGREQPIKVYSIARPKAKAKLSVLRS